MVNGRKLLGLIPARGGSKAIPRKNLCDVGGKPMISWTIAAARASRFLDRLVVSTDDAEIAQVAKQAGAEIPFMRPAALADDDVATIDVALHALDALPGYDALVLLQPTSPLRDASDIDGCVSWWADHAAESCATVTPTKTDPRWLFTVEGADRRLRATAGTIGLAPTRRQELTQHYVLTGSVYVASAQWLRTRHSFVGEGTIGFVVPPRRSVDVDDEIDLALVRQLLGGAESD